MNARVRDSPRVCTPPEASHVESSHSAADLFVTGVFAALSVLLAVALLIVLFCRRLPIAIVVKIVDRAIKTESFFAPVASGEPAVVDLLFLEDNDIPTSSGVSPVRPPARTLPSRRARGRGVHGQVSRGSGAL